MQQGDPELNGAEDIIVTPSFGSAQTAAV